MLSTDKAWRKWGEEDPYFGVLAEERFAGRNIAANRAAFFATGLEFVDHILRRYQATFGSLPAGPALDHGCGVGRLSVPLARHFEHVVALDISNAMLAEARANAELSKAANISFELADDLLSNASGRFAFVNSHMVLQHIPVRRGVPILLRLVDKVAPGGGFHLHLSFRTDRGFWRWLYWASANIPGVKLWQNICASRRWDAPAMQMNHYPLERILTEFSERGIHEFVLLAEPQVRFTTFSLLGRKPVGPMAE